MYISPETSYISQEAVYISPESASRYSKKTARLVKLGFFQASPSTSPSAQKFLRFYLEAKNIPTTKQAYGVRSPVASDVLLDALDGHHVAVGYRRYCILAEGQPSITHTHFPFGIVAFR